MNVISEDAADRTLLLLGQIFNPNEHENVQELLAEGNPLYSDEENDKEPNSIITL